jgi:hypothetical protein
MLKMRLSRYQFMKSEYGRAITFKIYDESDVAFVCTNYTPECIITDIDGVEVISQLVPTWTTQSSGIGTITFLDTKKINFAGLYNLQVILSKSDAELPTELVPIVVSESGVIA